MCLNRAVMESASEPRRLNGSVPLGAHKVRQGEKFEYQPLPDSARYLRLIEIQPARPDDEAIECTLSARPVLDTPEYYAVSYTWGDPNKITTIGVNSKLLEVRQNCQYVLWQARHLARSKYIWIDAICINQEDSEEKNHQVAMMGTIFGNAAHVLACIGPHAHDSEFAMQCLGQVRPSAYLGSSLLQWPGYWFFFQAMRWVFARDITEVVRASKAIRTLLERPYFERVWIIQEVFKKQSRVSLCCGQDCQPFASLFILRFILYSAQMNIYQYLHGSRSVIPYLTRKLLDKASGGKLEAIDGQWEYEKHRGGTAGFLLASSFSGRREESMFAGSTGTNGTNDLHQVVRWTSSFHCQDERDIIYGTLPLVDWQGTSPILPDYRKTRLALALDVLRRWRTVTDIEVYSISVLAKRLKIDFSDENLVAAISTRCQKAIESCQIDRSPQAQSTIQHQTIDEELLFLTGWHGVPLFDERTGYRVELVRVSGDGEVVRQQKVGFDSLSEYCIRIEDLKITDWARTPLNINVNLIVCGDVRIGDWIIYPRCHSSVFIIRPTLDDRFTIVSHGYLVESQDPNAPQNAVSLAYRSDHRSAFTKLPRRHFGVCFDVEYALIFTLICEDLQLGQRQFSIAHLKERLMIPVSSSESSAFAKRHPDR